MPTNISSAITYVGTTPSPTTPISGAIGVTQLNQQINNGVNGFTIQFTPAQTGANLTINAPSSPNSANITLGQVQVNYWPPGANSPTTAQTNASGQFVIPRTAGDSGLYLVQVFMEATITPVSPATSVTLPTTFCVLGCSPNTVSNTTTYNVGMTGMALLATPAANSAQMTVNVALTGGG